jgi:hypothetical protein
LIVRKELRWSSDYEWAAHSRLGRRAGMMTDADVARIIAGPDAGGGDPLETALLRATDELYRDDRVSDDTWAALAKGLDTKQLLDVLIAVGGYRSTSMAIVAVGESRSPPACRGPGTRSRLVIWSSPKRAWRTAGTRESSSKLLARL